MKCIVNVVKADGVTVQLEYDAVGQNEFSMQVLQRLKGSGRARLASAMPPPENIR